jgi:hypothetical protein
VAIVDDIAVRAAHKAIYEQVGPDTHTGRAMSKNKGCVYVRADVYVCIDCFIATSRSESTTNFNRQSQIGSAWCYQGCLLLYDLLYGVEPFPSAVLYERTRCEYELARAEYVIGAWWSILEFDCSCDAGKSCRRK